MVALLGLALMPYVKPVFMARRERLTRTDLVFLAVGTLLLLHVLTILGFGAFRLLALRSIDVAHLQTLADRVETTMLEDFRAHYDALSRLDGARCAAIEPASFADDEGFTDGGASGNSDFPAGLPRKG